MFSFNFARWLKSLFRRTVKPIQRKRRTRLALEQLEDRITPINTYTWTGAAGLAHPNWSYNVAGVTNWTNGTSAVAINTAQPFDLVFGTPTAYNTVNDLAAGATVDAITFTASNFTLTGNAINLANSATITVQGGLSGENIDLPMTLQTTAGSGQQFLEVSSNSTLTLQNLGAFTGGTTSQLTAEGGGTLIIQSSNSTFAGPFTINNDGTTVIADANQAFGSGASAANLVTVGANSQIQLEGNITIPSTVHLNGHGTSGSNGAIENVAGLNTWTGNIVMENSVEFDMFGVLSSLTVSGVISDTGSGDSLTKDGQGQLILQNADTYRGQTLINDGILTIENPLALGAVPSAGTTINADAAAPVNQGSLQIELLNGASTLTTVPANSQYYILGNPSLPFNAVSNPYVGFVVPDYTLNLSGTGYLGNYSLDNATGDNAWSGPIVLGTAANGNVNIEVDSTGAGVQTQFDVTGLMTPSQNNQALMTQMDKIGTGNLVLEPTMHNATIDQGNTYKLDPYGDLAQFTGQGAANTFAGSTPVFGASVDAGTLTMEDSQAFAPTAEATFGVIVLNGAALDFVANVGHIDSVTGVTNRLQVNMPLILSGTGYNYPVAGPDGAAGAEGTLNSVSGINTITPRVPFLAHFNTILDLGASIGVLAEPTETANNNYFTNDYSLTISGGIQDSQDFGSPYGPNGADTTFNTPISAPPVELTKVGAGQLILPNANPDLYGAIVIAQGWVTAEDPLSLGGELFGSVVNVAQPAFFSTTVETGAALMLRSPYPNTPLTLDTNLILEGNGISHAFGLINDMGALENLEGVNTITGNVTLVGQAGIGVEQVDPTILSNLTLTGEITQLQANAYNSPAIPTIPANIAIPSVAAVGGVSQYTQIVDTGSTSFTGTINYTNFVGDQLQVYYGPLGTPGSHIIAQTGIITLAIGALPFSDAADIGNSTQIEIVVDLGSTANGSTGWSYNANVVVNAPTFTGGIVKLGSQALVIEGNGTYQGGVDIREGIVVDENDTGLGTPLYTGAAGASFSTTVEAGAALVLSPTVADLNGGLAVGESTWADHLTLIGTGNSTFGYAPLSVLADDNLWSGGISLESTISLTFEGATLGNQALPADPVTVDQSNPANPATVSFAGLLGTDPTITDTTTTLGSAVADLSDVETLTFGGTITGGNFTMKVWNGAGYTTTGNIGWSADPNTLIQHIETQLNAAGLSNEYMLSLNSPTIDVFPDSRLTVLGAIDDTPSNAAFTPGTDLYLAGGGELALDGSDTYRGTTYVNQGILTVANGQALGGPGITGTQSLQLTNAVALSTSFQLYFDPTNGAPVVGANITPAITYTGTAADASNIAAALNALTSITSAGGSVEVIQENPGVFLVTFLGGLAGTSTLINPSIFNNAGVASAAIAAGVEGGTQVANGAQIQLQGGITVADEPLTVQGSGSNAEPTEQTFTVSESTIGSFSGTYKLGFNGAITGALPYNATAAQVQADLNNLSTVDGLGSTVGGQVSVSLTSTSAGADDTQTLFVPIGATGATNATKFGLSFGPTYSTGYIFTGVAPDAFNPADPVGDGAILASALDALTNVADAGGVVSVSGSFQTVNGTAGILFTITFGGGLADEAGLPGLALELAPAPASGPGIAGIIVPYTHTQGAPPSNTYEVVFQGGFGDTNEPLLTAPTASQILPTTVSTPALSLAGGSANNTPDQWFSNSLGTAANSTVAGAPTSTSISNVQTYYGTSNAENAAGPVISIAVDPTDQNVIYIATAGGGAFRTDDGGQTWQPLFDSAFAGANPAAMFGGAIAIDPSHTNIIYYATGNDDISGFGFGATDSYYGTGVYMSTDYGNTWTLLTDTSNAAYTVNISSPGNPLYGLAISQIKVMDPTGATPYSIAVAASDVNAADGIDVNGLSGNAGVWEYNEGKWTNTTAGITPTGGAGPFPSTDADYVDIFYDTGTGIMFASYFNDSGGALQTGVYSVPNFQGAGPWVWTADAAGFAAGAGESKLGGLVAGSGNPLYAAEDNAGALGQIQLWDGVNWTTQSSVGLGTVPNYLNPVSGYASAIFLDTQPGPFQNALFVGGTDQAPTTGQPGTDFVLESVSQGTTWMDIVNPTGTSADVNGPETSVHEITDDTAGDVYFATDGGVWEYSTVGVWTDLTGNLADSQYVSVSTDPNNASVILAGGHSVGLARYSTSATAYVTEAGGSVPLGAFGLINPDLAESAQPEAILNGGAGYNPTPGDAPTVTFVGGGNPTSEAVATAVVSPAGVITSIDVTFGGTGYSSAPEVVIASSGVPTWTQVAGGGDFSLWGGNGTFSDGGEVEFVPTGAGSAYFMEAGGTVGGTTYGMNYTTTDGITWATTNIYPNPLPPQYNPQYAPFQVDPNQPGRIVAADGPWSSTGFGNPPPNQSGVAGLESWTVADFGGAINNLNPPAALGAIIAIGQADFQGAYQADPNFVNLAIFPANHPDPSTLYVTDGASVYVTKDGGAHWVERTPTLVGNTAITDVIVDPADRDTAWVVTSGSSGATGVGHVFETTNAGQTWTDISTGLPDQSVWTIADDPYTNNLYIGTDTGVYELAGGVGTWEKFGAGLPDVMVTDININTNANVLTVSTYGRGVWQFYLDDTSANAGALRALGGNNVWNGPVILAGPTTIGANGSQNLAAGFSGAQLTILGPVSDATANALGNTLTKVGGGNLVLAGSNTYAGVTLVTQGNVVVDNPDALGSPGAISLTGVTDGTDGIVTGLASTAQLVAGMPVTGAGVAPGTTILTVNSPTSVTLSSVPTAGTPLLTFNGGTQLLFLNDMVPDISQYTLSFAGSTTPFLLYTGVAATDAAAIQSALQRLATIGTNNVLVTPEGNGAFLLTFPNAPLDSTQLLVTANIVNSANNGVLGSSFTEVAGGTVVESGAALELESSLLLEPITLFGNGIQPPFDGHYTGALDNVSNNNTYTGTLTLGSNSTIGVTAGELIIDSANTYGIMDGGTVDSTYSLDKEGNGTLVLASPDTYLGDTTVTVGALEIENSDALGDLAIGGLTITGDSVSGFTSTADLSAGLTVTGPDIPSGTTIQSVAANSIVLSNSASQNSSGATVIFTSSTFVSDGAQLQVSAAAGPTLTSAAATSGTGLLPNTTYYYVVTAVNANGDESVVSNEVSVATTAGMQQATLAWDPVAGAVFYNVYRSTTAGDFTNALLAIVDFTVTSFTDTGAATMPYSPAGLNVLGQHLYLSGTGLVNDGALRNVAGNNTWAGQITLSAQPNYSTTSSPQGVVAVYVDPTNTLTLSNNINEGPPTPSPVQNATQPENIGAGLAAGNYYYAITAVTPYGESAIGAPQEFTSSGGSSHNEALLTWTQVPGATSYNVYRTQTLVNGVPSFAGAFVIPISGGTTTQYSDAGAGTPGTPNAAASSGLAEIGAGTLVLAGDNTFTGGTYVGYDFGNVNDSGAVTPSALGSGGVNGGVIDVENSNALGADQGNEIQRIDTFEPPNTNTRNFTLSFDGVSTPAPLNYGSTAAQVQAALDGLSTINANGVTVSESAVQTGLDEVQTVTLTNPTAGTNAPVLSSMAASAGGNLTATTEYNYVVTAVIPSLGETLASNVESATTTVGSLTIPLSWSAVPGATSYKIYRSIGAANATDFNQAYLTTVAATAYTDTGAALPATLAAPSFNAATNTTVGVGGSLSTGSTYDYVITAIMPSGALTVESATSTVLSVPITTTGEQKVNLSWSVVPGASGYRIYRSSAGPSFSNALIATIDSGATTAYTDTGTVSATFSPPPAATQFDLQFSVTMDGKTNNVAPNQKLVSNLPSTSQLGTVFGMPPAVTTYVSGAGIPAGTTVTDINSATSVTLSNTPTAGVNSTPLTFTQITGAITYKGVAASDAADIQAALQVLTPIGQNNVVVTADPTDTVFTITFIGALADTPETTITPVVGLTQSSATILNSATVSVSAAILPDLVPGMLVSGAGIPTGTTIDAVNLVAKTITLSAASTGPTGSVPLTFVEPTVSAAGAEVTPGDGGTSYIYTVQFTGAPLNSAAQPMIVVTPNSTELTAGASETATGAIGALVYNGGALQVDGDPAESNPNTASPEVNVPAGETLALNGDGQETLTLEGPSNAVPTTFTLQVGSGPPTAANTTLPITYTGSDAAAVQTALNSLSAITSTVGSVLVTQTDSANTETFIITGLSASAPVTGTVTSLDAGTAFFDAPDVVAGALINNSGTNVWNGNVILQSSSTVAAAATTNLTVAGLVQDAPLPAANPVPTTAPASLTKIGAGAISLAPATQVINLSNAVSPLNPPTGLSAAVSGAVGSGAVSTRYFYEVTAIGPSGETVPSAAVQAGPGTPNNQLVSLNWTDPFASGDTGYRVYRSTTGAAGSFYLLANIDSGATTSYTDNGLTTPNTSDTPPVQTFFTLNVGGHVIGPIGYTDSTGLSATIQTALNGVTNNGVLPTDYGVTATVTALNANSFTVTLIGTPSAIANVPAMTAAISTGPGGIAVNTNTFAGDVYDNAGVLNIQSAQALGVTTSAVEDVNVTGSSGSFALFFNSQNAPNGSATLNSTNVYTYAGSPAEFANLALGMEVNGFGITAGTTITGLISGTQQVTLSAPATVSGSQYLEYGTPALQYGLPATGGASPSASVENALDFLPWVGANGVTVTQSGDNYYVYFNGANLREQYQSPLTYEVVNNGVALVITHPLAGGASNVDVASGASLQLQSNTTAQAFSEDSGKYLTIDGNGFDGNGALENVSGNNTWGATGITLGATSAIGADAGSTLNLDKPITDTFQTPTIEFSIAAFNGFTAGDTYSLSYGGSVSGALQFLDVTGNPTGLVPATTDADQIQQALESLPSVIALVPPGDTVATMVQVSWLGGHSYNVTFLNSLYGTFNPVIGSVPISTSNGGSFVSPSGSASDGYGVNIVEYQPPSERIAGTITPGVVWYNVGNTYTGTTTVEGGTLKLNNSITANSGYAVPADLQVGVPTPVNQVQTLTLTGFQQLDQFTLSYGPVTTPVPITYYQDPAYEAAAIQAGLNANAALGANYVSVTAVSATSFLVTLNGLDGANSGTKLSGADLTSAGTVSSSINPLPAPAPAATPGSAGAPIAQLEASTSLANSAGQINPAMTVTVMNDGLFDLNDFTQTIFTLTVIGGEANTGVRAAGTGNLTVTGNVIINNNGQLDLPGNGDVALINGTLTITDGFVNESAYGSATSLTVDGLVTVTGGAINLALLDQMVLESNLVASSDANGPAQILGQGIWLMEGADPTITVTHGATAAASTTSDLIVTAGFNTAPQGTPGTTGVTKAGAGRMELAADTGFDGYEGATTIDAGDLQVDSVFFVAFNGTWTNGDTFQLTYSNGLAGVGVVNGSTNNITYTGTTGTAPGGTDGNIVNALISMLESAFGLLPAVAAADVAVVPYLPGNPSFITVAFLGAAGSDIGMLNDQSVHTAHGGTLSITPAADLGNVVLSGSSADTASLSGTGTVATSSGGIPAISVAPGMYGTINPGVNGANPATPGILNTDGNVSFGPGSGTFFVDLNDFSGDFPTPNAGTDYDQLNVTGDITLNNALLGGAPDGAALLPTDTFKIMQASGTITGWLYADVYGTPEQIGENGSVFLDGQNFTVQYYTITAGTAGATGNYIQLTRQEANLPSFTLSSSANPSFYGQDVTFTALATPEYGASFATANPVVTFNVDSGSYIDPATVNPAVQELSLSGFSAGNQFTLTYFNGTFAGTTPGIPYTGNPTTDASSIQTALNNLLTAAPFNFPSGEVMVSAVDSNDFTITFTGTLTGQAAAGIYPLLGAVTSGAGSIVGTVTNGAGGVALPSVVTYAPQSANKIVWGPTPVGSPHVITAAFKDLNGVFTSPVLSTPAAIDQVVNPNVVNIALGSSLTGGQATYGQSFNLTGTLNPVYPLNLITEGAQEPTGSLTFYVDGAQVASLPTTGFTSPAAPTSPTFTEPVPGSLLLAPGPHTIDVTYSGDPNYSPAPTPPTINTFQYSFTVVADSTTLSITPAPVSSDLGQNATFNVVVAPGLGASSAGHPQGTVNFYDGNPLLGGTLLNTSGPITIDPVLGTASFSTKNLSLGSHSIYVVFTPTPGNTNYTGITNFYNFIVQKASTSTMIQPPLPSASYGSASTFTVQVAEDPSITSVFPLISPTGSVTLYAQPPSGATTLTTASFAVGGPVTISVTPGSGTNFTVGQLVYITDTSNILIGTVVGPLAANTLEITPTAIVADVTGSMASGATVTTVINAGSGALSGTDSATITTAATGPNALPIGNNVQLYAVYSGDSNFAVSEDASEIITVNGAPANVVVTSTLPSPANFAASIPLKATVSSSVAGLPTGPGSFVTFWDVAASNLLTTTAGAFAIPAVGNSIAVNVISITGLSDGQYLYIASGGNAIIAQITAPVAGSPVTVTTVAVLAGAAGNTMATNASVSSASMLNAAPANLVAGDTASYLVPADTIPAGLNTIYASYTDTVDGHFANGVDTPLTNYAVDDAPTTTVPSSTPTPPPTPVYGQLVTLTATVTSPGGPLPTPGTIASSVTFKDVTVPASPVTLGTGDLMFNGTNYVATLQTSTLSAGAHDIEAIYSDTIPSAANPYFSPSTSAIDPVSIIAAPTTITTVTSSSPGNTSGLSATPVTYTATVVTTNPPSNGAAVTAGTVSFYDVPPSTTISVGGAGFSIPAVNATVSATFNSSVTSGQTLYITGGGNTIFATVTSAGSGTTMNIKTLAILSGSAGNSMASGSSVYVATALTGSPATVASGKASATATYSTVAQLGTHTIWALYNPPTTGTINYGPATPNSTTQTVLQTATMSAVATPAAPKYGQPVSLAVTLAPMAPSTAMPTGGTVTVVDQSNGNAVLATGTLVNGTVPGGLSLAGPLSAGSHTLLVSYTGDTVAPVPFAPVSKTITLTVSPAVTSIALMSNVPGTSEATEPVTFTATLSVPATVPAGTPGLPLTGTVTFKDSLSTTPLQVVTLNGGNVNSPPYTVTYGPSFIAITYTTTSLATNLSPGHTITAVYSGSNPASPTTESFAASPTSNAVTQKVAAAGTLGALVGPAQWTENSTVAYSGTITFTKSAGATGTLTTANVMASGLPTGIIVTSVTNTATTATITIGGIPTVSGPPAFTPIISVMDSAGVTVSKMYTITINPPLTLGTLSTTTGSYKTKFSATIAITGGTAAFAFQPAVTGLPAGLTATISGSTITISGTPTAVGTTNFNIGVKDAGGFTLAAQPFSITIAPAATTITSFTASSTTALVGSSVKFTAVVTSAVGAPNPGGVTITDANLGVLGTASLVSVSGNTATYALTYSYPLGTSPRGLRTITATYNGSNSLMPSTELFAASAPSSAINENVVNTALTLTASTLAPAPNQTVTFTIKLNSPTESAADDTITVTDNGVTIGTYTLTGGGPIYKITFSRAFAAGAKNVIAASFADTDSLGLDPASASVTVTSGATLR